MFSVPSQPSESRGERLGEFVNRSVKTRDAVDGFHLLENSHKLCQGFHQDMKARITCFISFVKLLFSVLTKRKMIYEAHMNTLLYFMKLLIHTTWRQSQSYCSHHVRASQRYENTLVGQSKRTYYPNYFVKYFISTLFNILVHVHAYHMVYI